MATTIEVDEEWGTTAEKLFKFLGLPEDRAKVRAVKEEFCRPPLLKRIQFLAKECDLELESFAVACAIVVVRGKGNEYLASVCAFLHNEEEVPAASIRDSVSTAYHLYNWEHDA